METSFASLIRYRWQRLRKSSSFWFLVFLGLLGTCGAFQGYIHWWDFRIQQMLKRNNGYTYRNNSRPWTVKSALANRLLEPFIPITHVQLQPKTPISESDLALLEWCWWMTHLEIYGPVSANAHRRIGHFRGLQRLTLMLQTTGPAASDLEAISYLPDLRVVDVSGCRSEISGLRHFARLKNLATLYVENRSPAETSTSIESASQSAPRLRLERDFATETFQQLAQSQTLRHLRIANFADFRDEHLLAMTSELPNGDEPFPALESLDLTKSGISGRGLKYLGNLRNLKSLILAGTRVDDEGVRSIRKVRPLKILDLSRTHVGDHGAAMISEMPQLGALLLMGTMISEDGLLKLIVMKEMRHLRVDKDVSLETVVKLRSYFPCYVK